MVNAQSVIHVASARGPRASHITGGIKVRKMPEKINNKNIFGRTFSKPRVRERIFVSMVTLALVFAAWPLAAFQDAQGATQARQALPHAQQTLDQLQQLVAPIALYADSLVAQILAASTFPEQ